MLAAVDMAAEMRSFLLQLALACKREHLKTAAVSEDRAFPADEPVQAAGCADNVAPGPQVQVVRVAKYDLRLDVIAQLPLVDSLDTADSTHRHENRRVDSAVICGYDPGTG